MSDLSSGSEINKGIIPAADIFKARASEFSFGKYSEALLIKMKEPLLAKLLSGKMSLNPTERAVFNMLSWEFSSLRARESGDVYRRFKNVQERLGLAASSLELQFSSKHSTNFINIWFNSLPINEACGVATAMSYEWQGHTADSDRFNHQFTEPYDLIPRFISPPGIALNISDFQARKAFCELYEYRNSGYGFKRVEGEFPSPTAVNRLYEELNLMAKSGQIVPFAPFHTHRREDGFYRSYHAYTSRGPFGQGMESRHIIEGIETAIEQEQARGSTIFIHGRLDVDFFEKLTKSDASGKLVKPDIEIVYSLRLPSGVDHHFVIKPARDFTLKPKNDYAAYSEEDLELVAKLDAHFQRRDTRNPDSNYRNALKVFNELTPGDFPEDLRGLLHEPLMIDDLLDLCRYEDARLKSIWRKLSEFGGNYEAREYDYGHRALYEDREVFRAALINSLKRLSSYEHLAHHAAIPQTEKEQLEFLSLYEDKLYAISKRERDAIKNEPEETAVGRKALGYMGPTELYGLPLEHMVYDMICDFNAVKHNKVRRRSYEDKSKVYKITELPSLLNSPAFKRIVTARISDPANNTSEIVTGEKRIRDIFPKLLDQNLERMRKAVSEGKLSNENEEIVLTSLLSYLDKDLELAAVKKKSLNSQLWTSLEEASHSAKDEGLTPSERKKVSDEIKADFRRSEEAINQAVILRKLNFERLARLTFGEYAQENLLRLDAIHDSYTAKFIYIIGRDGLPLLSPEKIDGKTAKRRTHSEVAGGANLAAAGEIVFTRYQKQFTNWHNWLKFTERAEEFCSLPWRLTEKNNATGHYQMPPTILKYVDSILVPAIESIGISAKNARAVDKLVPGLRLQGLGTYW